MSESAAAPPPPPGVSPSVFRCLGLANSRRLSIRRCPSSEPFGGSPLLSSFVVCCTISYTTLSFTEAQTFVAANSEPCSLQGSICAERAALAALPSVAPDLTRILAVHILSDSETPITPGFLCREYMNTRFPKSVLDPSEVPVILAGTKGDQVDWASLTTRPLRAYWPAPSIYAGLRVSDEANFRRLKLCGECQGSEGIPSGRGNSDYSDSDYSHRIKSLYHHLKGMAEAHPSPTRHPAASFHKVRYAAGALFSNGSVAAALQVVGLEYGTTIDPVGRLCRDIENNIDNGAVMTAVMVVDCFGGVHAPFASGRAFLGELGPSFAAGNADVYYHEKLPGGGVRLRTIKIKEMCEDLPAFDVGDLN